jgi:hypothetical protein
MAAARARSRLADPLPEAKPRADAYVGLLALSLIAMVTCTVFLFLDYNQYSGSPVPPPAKYTPPTPQAPVPPTGLTSG